jgi:hypothetical protein
LIQTIARKSEVVLFFAYTLNDNRDKATWPCQNLKKLALIAVANKLLKQSFAIATSGLVYNQYYVSIKAKTM